MILQSCKCCGQLVLPWEELWAAVDPTRPRRAEWLCADCEHAFEADGQVIVFTDRRHHVATLLSERGLRAARLDAAKTRAA